MVTRRLPLQSLEVSPSHILEASLSPSVTVAQLQLLTQVRSLNLYSFPTQLALLAFGFTARRESSLQAGLWRSSGRMWN